MQGWAFLCGRKSLLYAYRQVWYNKKRHAHPSLTKGAHADLKQSKWGKIFNGAVIALSVGMVLYILFSADDLTGILQALSGLQPWWLAGTVGCYALYILAEGAGLAAFLYPHGYRTSLLTAAHLSLIGIFYGYVTPGYSGGQPMQVYHMARRKVDAGLSLSAVTVRHFFNHLSFVSLAVGLWIANHAYVREQVGHLTALIIIGLFMTFANVPLTIAVVLARPWVERLTKWVIRLLAKLGVCREMADWQERSMKAIAQCHGAMVTLLKSPGQIAVQLLASMAEATCMMLVPYMAYRALGLEGHTMVQLLTIAFLLFVSASYAPLPGASGAQEGGFLAFFGGSFGALAPAGLLLWRFATYYLCLLTGCADTVWLGLRGPLKPVERISLEGRKQA